MQVKSRQEQWRGASTRALAATSARFCSGLLPCGAGVLAVLIGLASVVNVIDKGLRPAQVEDEQGAVEGHVEYGPGRSGSKLLSVPRRRQVLYCTAAL